MPRGDLIVTYHFSSSIGVGGLIGCRQVSSDC